MSHNCGYAVALKTTAAGGGVFSLTHVDGGTSSAPQRGLQPRGSSSGVGSLTIYNPSSSTTPRMYPVEVKFDSNGIALIDFMYDHAVIPHTVAGPGGILATNFRYRTKIGSSIVNGNGQLLHFSNIGHTSRMGRHMATPSVPLPRVQNAIDAMVARARQLAAVANSMSRPCLAGIVIV
ncbi:hypothetical protein [uncultured Tateyamaria sp.]|uniref:hypothetical protein n=1 Tax=Tateyamaria sp. 1078 TaxID=3417464 RepID=UPI0026372C83|nr:hypothetical protein [uncultured Tateyamaria sp.]